MNTPNPTQQLAEIILGRPLGEYVAELRSRGHTWREVSETLSTDTRGRINVSYEALRVWYRNKEAVA